MRDGQSALERVADLDAPEASVVAIVGPDGSHTVLEHEGNDVRVGNQVAGGSCIVGHLGKTPPELLAFPAVWTFGRASSWPRFERAAASGRGRAKIAGCVAMRRYAITVGQNR